MLYIHNFDCCSWGGGVNHLVFNMLPGSQPHYNTTPDFNYGKVYKFYVYHT